MIFGPLIRHAGDVALLKELPMAFVLVNWRDHQVFRAVASVLVRVGSPLNGTPLGAMLRVKTVIPVNISAILQDLRDRIHGLIASPSVLECAKICSRERRRSRLAKSTADGGPGQLIDVRHVPIVRAVVVSLGLRVDRPKVGSHCAYINAAIITYIQDRLHANILLRDGRIQVDGD
jgi:hypothetical protein